MTNKKYLITIEEITTRHSTMDLEGTSAMEVLDEVRKLVSDRNKHCPKETIYCVKKVEEVKDE